MGQRLLTLAFLTPNATDHWVNRLTSYVGQHPICHVELFFESINQCFSIMWGEFAQFRFKNLSNPNYRVISLAVSAREYELCLEFCRSMSTHGIGFDESGMWRTWLPLSCCEKSSQETGSTFCSKIITEALQFGNISEVDHLIPCRTSPSSLYECVRGSPRVVCNSVPFKRQMLMSQLRI